MEACGCDTPRCCSVYTCMYRRTISPSVQCRVQLTPGPLQYPNAGGWTDMVGFENMRRPMHRRVGIVSDSWVACRSSFCRLDFGADAYEQCDFALFYFK